MSPRRGLLTLARSGAFGALTAQVWQAVGSFALQVFAAWMLGAAGLGLISLTFGIIVLATAVVGGVVGDSLTVLDRHDRRIRGGLEFWAVVLTVTSAAGTSILLAAVGVLTVSEAAWFGAAMMAFQVEQLIRRIFMATMRFWRLVIIDTTALVGVIVVLGIARELDRVDTAAFFIALLVGQLIGIFVGLLMLPSAERRLVSIRGAAIGEVFSFGSWRGAQVSIPPLVLTAMRLLVAFVVGKAALGELEAARIFVAPAMLAVQGLGSYLLSSYVRDKARGTPALYGRARRGSHLMIGAALVFGAILVAVAPILTPYVTGPQISVDRVAVAGWVLYVAGSASCQPFASLAAARGRPARVFACRVVDAAAALLLMVLLLGPVGAPPSWVPYALAAGLFLGGVLVRTFALKPLLRTQPEPVHIDDVESSRASYASR